MFEKEAEFYAREKYSPKTDSFIVAAADDAFYDGANFGYKKCQEEMQKNGLALQSDMDKTIEQNMALKKACDETQELLDKQIEATYKVVEENNELKEKLNKATEILKVVLNKWKEERWILQSEKEVKMIENVMKEAEAF